MERRRRRLARLKQERIAKAAQRVVGDLGVPGFKYGMDFNGYYGGPSRLPFLPLTARSEGRDRESAGGYSELTTRAACHGKKDQPIAIFDKDKTRWFTFELSSHEDLHYALDYLGKAFDAARSTNKTR